MRIAADIEHYLFEHEDRDLPEFIVLGFSGQEGISQLTNFEIELLCSEQDLDFSKILNRRAALRIWCWQDNDYGRVYHGIISSFEQAHQAEEYSIFRAQMFPFLWRLTLNSQSRIFQDKSVPEIIQDVLKGAGFQSDDYRLSLKGRYEALNKPPREFCIQYRESDFDFISRLMEEEGIFYFFEYTENKEVLVIADDPSVHEDTMPASEAEFRSPIGLQPLEEEFVYPLHYRESILPARVALKDFNYDTPQTNLLTVSQTDQQGSSSVYDYPGRFGFLDRGADLARIRKQEIDAGRKIVSGESNCRSFCAGHCFTLSGHNRADLNRRHLLTSVSHHGTQPGTLATGSQISYENQFECIPSDSPYRPPRVTAKPVVQGAQTAIVVGPQNEEIYVDEKGRVKIQFHWDLEGEYDEKSSCWIRVSQAWAGAGWGGVFIPRIGQEVIVEFLEGDPDQPIVTGSVYNGDHQVPYRLPDEKTKAVIKSNSSTGGEGANEIRFEDMKGEEQIFIHAEKNQDNRVKNDSLEWVGTDRHLVIKQDQLELVEGDKHLGVKGDHNEKVDGTISVQSGMDMQEKVSMKYALDAGTEIHLKSGTNLVIESGTTLTLKVGENFININSGGVFIKGSMVMINSGGAAGSGSGASPESPKAPQEADTSEPGRVGETPTQKPPQKPTAYSPGALVLKEAAHNARPFCPT
ncbi:type VI secretion system Vgr family protein [Candidatus Poribacteria bacterium]